MKYIVWVSLLSLISFPSVAQRGGFSGGRGGREGGARGGFGAGRSGGARSRARFVRGFNQRLGPGFYGDFYPYALPLFGGDYDLGYPSDFEYPPPPATIIEPPARTVTVQQAPPSIGHPVTHEYASGPPAGGEPTFVIALSDGSQVQATAVWVQDRTVHYIDPGEQSRQLPLASIDRDLTRKLNQERNLNLRLPPQ